MCIVYVVDHDECLLGLYTSIDTSARLRQTCKPFATNVVLLARRPHLQLRTPTGDVAVRAPGKHAYAFPTMIDSDDGTWKVQKKTFFKLSVAIVANLAFVDEDAQGSIIVTPRERVCTHTLATPTRSIEVCAHLVTGDGVAVEGGNDGGTLFIGHGTPKVATAVPSEALPFKCSVTTLSGKVFVLDRMRDALAKEEQRLARLARHAFHEDSCVCVARIDALKEAIQIDQACVGKSGWQGKPSAHFRLRLSMTIAQRQGARRTTRFVLGTTVDTHPFFVVARVETPTMKIARVRRDEKHKEYRAERREDALEEWAAGGLRNAEIVRRDVFGRWYGSGDRRVEASGQAAHAADEAAEDEPWAGRGPAEPAGPAGPARPAGPADHRSDAAYCHLSAAAAEEA
jgi:hypothetical protein